MDYSKIEEIKELLTKNGFSQEVEELNSRIASGSTGGEIRGAVFHFLFNLKKENPQAENVIKEQIEELKKYAESIGFVLR